MPVKTPKIEVASVELYPAAINRLGIRIASINSDAGTNKRVIDIMNEVRINHLIGRENESYCALDEYKPTRDI
ncbi:hypothetical protein D3C71_2124140 [compost metagenome]